MRIAIIDLGTNAIRFDIHQIGRSRIKRLHRERLTIRLGKGVFITGKLDPETRDRALQALKAFKRIIQKLQVDRTLAFATCALRETDDREDFVKKAKQQAGIRIHVISGAEEARLIALGILSNEDLPRGAFALVDVGGGSTEVSLCTKKKLLHSFSLPLGAVRLQQIFLKQSPPSRSSIAALRTYIQNQLSKNTPPGISNAKFPMIIGSSGTTQALARLFTQKRNRKKFKLKDLRRFIANIALLTHAELLKMPGMEIKRADVILAGAILLEEIMLSLFAKEVVTTDYALRDGMIAEELELYRKKSISHVHFHLDEIRKKAAILGVNPARLRKAATLSRILFKRLEPLHHLKPEWENLLFAATMLKDTGESIDFANHITHSYYIAKHMDIPGIVAWESEFIAQLCRHHETRKLNRKKLPFKRDHKKQSAFLKLLGLLHLIDALDSGLTPHIPIKSIRIQGQKTFFYFEKTTESALEALRLERKTSIIKEIFRHKIVVRHIHPKNDTPCRHGL
jgi:exopolyphosphatase / guanosine-5'-triphosphate,3'-diphosphate pyrophosphatase